MYINTTDKKEQHYITRKEKADKAFEWTKERVQKLRRLNDALTKIQIQLVEQMQYIYSTLLRLEKEGLYFLHGFMVVGTYVFGKSVISEYDELETMTKAQKSEYKKWEDIGFCASKELNKWHLVLDSATGDFLPLSKVRMNQTVEGWHKSPQNQNVSVCSYLYHLLEYNRTLSLEDLMECTGKDFYPDVFVTLNYPTSELEALPDYQAHDGMIADILHLRAVSLNACFKWSKKNIAKIMDVNELLWKQTFKMRLHMKELSDALKKLSSYDPVFKNYFITGHIEYHGSTATDIATLELQKQMSRTAMFDSYMLTCNDEWTEVYDSNHDVDPELNWNFEVYRNHFTPEQQKILFHYFMHSVFVDDCIYSFEDLVRMREEDFKPCLRITF